MNGHDRTSNEHRDTGKIRHPAPHLLPACWLGTVTVHSDHHVFWVTVGRARILVGGVLHDLGESEGLWIPPGVPVDQITTDPGTAAFTVLLPSALFPDAPGEVTRRVLTPALCDILLHLFSRWVTPAWRTPAVTTELAADLCRAFTGGTGTVAGQAGAAVPFPAMPVSVPAVAVARQLVDDPADPRTLRDRAEDAGVSPRHLTRLFGEETGLSFALWRTELRLAVAARALAGEASVGQIAARVGYASAASFSRAFLTRTGVTPVQYRDRDRDRGTASAAPASVAPAPAVPAGQLLPLVNGDHALVWLARGSARVRLRDTKVALDRGQLLWLPAGVWHEVTTGAGGVLLYVGSLPAGVPMTRHHVVPFRRSGTGDAELLYRAAVVNTLLRPYPWDAASFSADLRSWLPPVRARFRNRPVGDILQEPADPRRTLATWSAQLGVDRRELAGQFLRDTGQSFREWSVDRRMTVARSLLRRPGQTVSGVAAAVGYRTTISFVRVFRERHGMTPGEFRRDHRTCPVFEVVE